MRHYNQTIYLIESYEAIKLQLEQDLISYNFKDLGTINALISTTNALRDLYNELYNAKVV
jgi:hypothetical protein